MSLVYFDLSIAGHKARLVFRLYDEYVPKTAANFRSLCKGDVGHCRSNPSIRLSYKNCTFHRVIRGFMCQSGDFTNHNGTGGESIYGAKFADESFRVKHSRPGLLSMANSGPNTNGNVIIYVVVSMNMTRGLGSQFFITFSATPHLDGKHVVFGEVIDGLDHLKKIEGVSTDAKDKPLPGQEIIIVDCGEIESTRASTKNDDRDFKDNKTRSLTEVKSSTEKKLKSKKEKKEKKEKKSKENKKHKIHKKARVNSSSTESEAEKDVDVVKPLKRYTDEHTVVPAAEKSEPPPPRVGADGTVYRGRGTMRYQGSEETRQIDRRPFNSRNPRSRSRSRDRGVSDRNQQDELKNSKSSTTVKPHEESRRSRSRDRLRSRDDSRRRFDSSDQGRYQRRRFDSRERDSRFNRYSDYDQRVDRRDSRFRPDDRYRRRDQKEEGEVEERNAREKDKRLDESNRDERVHENERNRKEISIERRESRSEVQDRTRLDSRDRNSRATVNNARSAALEKGNDQKEKYSLARESDSRGRKRSPSSSRSRSSRSSSRSSDSSSSDGRYRRRRTRSSSSSRS